MDGMSAHGIDMVMTKKSNLEVVLPEKWACLVSPASHFSRFSPIACVRRGRYFANFAKSFRTGRSESTKRKISRNISRNNEESLERVPGVFSKMAASINDAVLLKYRVFERNKCYYCCYVLLMRV